MSFGSSGFTTMSSSAVAERRAKSVHAAAEAVIHGIVTDAQVAARVANDLESAGLLASSLDLPKIEVYIEKLNREGRNAKKH